MQDSQSGAVAGRRAGGFVLGIDTCGPTGSVALGRFSGPLVEMVGQTELEGRSYSATLVAAIAELLAQARTSVGLLDAIVVVNGPGSFTGVRVGLSAAKGLAEPARIPVVAVSRLAVLAWKTGLLSAALDAHRHEVFLRVAGTENQARELLAGASDLVGIAPPQKVAVCDEAAAELLGAAWPGAELVRVVAPTAADSLQLAAPRIRAGDFDDVVRLDGHYLRRSDAEIFGEPVAAAARRHES
jgi:tRNA threonylcarbamoyladenosine biosynthesis protein TsaB